MTDSDVHRQAQLREWRMDPKRSRSLHPVKSCLSTTVVGFVGVVAFLLGATAGCVVSWARDRGSAWTKVACLVMVIAIFYVGRILVPATGGKAADWAYFNGTFLGLLLALAGWGFVDRQWLRRRRDPGEEGDS